MNARDGGAGGRLLVLGLSHRTAPVAQREKAALAEPAARSALAMLRGDPAVVEAAVLSTCNRTEVFAVVADPVRGQAALGRALVEHSAITTDELAAASYVRGEQSAARHLFRVAASLDSMVIGESEIQGQVRAARDLAREEGTLGPLLHRTFTQALRTGRRVRSQTHVAAGARSCSSTSPSRATSTLVSQSFPASACTTSTTSRASPRRTSTAVARRPPRQS